jgi:hypothetical protein
MLIAQIYTNEPKRGHRFCFFIRNETVDMKLLSFIFELILYKLFFIYSELILLLFKVFNVTFYGAII